MFYNYKILESNNEEVLYLYTSSMYEFANEFNKNNKVHSIIASVKEYIRDMRINFNGKRVMFVVNGLIIGSLFLVTTDYTKTKLDTDALYHEEIDIKDDDNLELIDMNQRAKHEIETDNDGFIISNFVKMKDKKGHTTFVDLNNYITHELSKQISPTYEKEALKSASIITRTNVFRELYENNYLNGEEYRDITTLKKLWKKNFTTYFNNLKNAVEETSYQYLSEHHYYFNFDIRAGYFIPYSSYQANMLAKSGYKYNDILGHFYPDASIEIA